MKRELARRWAKALESGDYKQTEGALRNKNGFCCLGVLCNLHAQDNLKVAQDQGDSYTYLGTDISLPEEVIEWAAMRSCDGSLRTSVEDKDGYFHRCLIELNDSAGFTSPEIAKVIRKHYKEL